MDMSEERTCIERCQKGDREAFGPIVLAYRRSAYFTALGLVGNREEAYDLSQEAFVRAFRSIGQFDVTRKFAPWFFRILRNLCSTALSRRSARQIGSLDEMRDGGREFPAGEAFRADLLAERNEEAERVWRALGRLDAAGREIIVLKDLQEHRYREVAEILDIPIGTVMSRLYNARQKLREILIEQERPGGDRS